MKSKHSCRQMRKFNHMRSNRKCFIYKLILNILSYRENEILDFPLFPVKLVDGDLKYEVVQNFYSKISGTVNYAKTSYVSNQKFDVKFFFISYSLWWIIHIILIYDVIKLFPDNNHFFLFKITGGESDLPFFVQERFSSIIGRSLE